MRSLKRVFLKIQRENPCWSSYICFAEAVLGRKFSKQIISKYFHQLVDRDDYSKEGQILLLRQLFKLSWDSKK